MIELAFVTCLLAQPRICAPHSLLFEERGGLFQCMLSGHTELARWVETHPRERVVRWSCRHATAKETML